MEEQDFDFEWLLHLVSHEESAETESVDFFDPLEFELLMELDPLEDWELMLQSETVFQQRGRGNPASRSSVENLPLVHLLEVDTCGICMEDMLVEDLIKMLPCRHHFHGQCIDPWFELQNTCPVCRYQLPTNNPTNNTNNPSEEEEIGYG